MSTEENLRERIRNLEAALEPFAKYCRFWEEARRFTDSGHDRNLISSSIQLKRDEDGNDVRLRLGHVRNAVRVLAGEQSR